jgi:hypothetical protein
MPEIHDGEELAITLPDGAGVCLVYPPEPGDPAACAAMKAAPVAAGPGERLVAAGAVRLDGVPTPVRFAVRFTPEAHAVEPTLEVARDFAAREAAARAARADVDAAVADAATLELVAVGRFPTRGAAASDLVAVGGLHAARAAFVLDLRESGHDVPVHVVSYGAWAREGVYTLSVEGDDFHATQIEAFADEGGKTLWLKDPAPQAPSDAAQIGARLGQIGLGVMVLAAIVLAVLGARTRRARN